MKKILLLFSVLLSSIALYAADPYFYLDPLKLKQGETATVSVKLYNEAVCQGFSFDYITLPEGLTFVDNNLEASDRVPAAMTVQGTIKDEANRQLRVAAVGVGVSIAAGDGDIFSFKVKVAEDAPLGTFEIKFQTPKARIGGNKTFPDFVHNVTIYTTYVVTAAPNKEAAGTVTGADEYENGTNATLTATANTGYQFTKWSDESTDNPYTFAVNGDVTLTAQFDAINYNLSYELAGGAVATENPASYTIESEAITLNNPTKTGYDFAGWTGTDLTAATTTVTIAKGSTGDRSYTATWTPITYTISYDLAGGSVATANPANYTIESEAITLVNPTREGYTFAGWTGTGLTAATMNVTIAKGSMENRSYTATWTPVTYNISYELAGGAVATANPATYTIESEAITLVNPTREGYEFAGWTGTGLTAATKNVTIAKGSTGDRSYTATWTAIVYNISYDLAGGAVATANPANYTIESDAITLVNPTREGYTFAGWTGTGLTAATMNVTIAKGSIGERSYTATWTANTYTLSYDLAGGAVATANPTTYTIESEAITLVNPTREGYEFAGWTGTGLTAATKNVTIAKGSIGDRSYTATWTPIVYNISYDLAGGSVATANPATYTIESEAITLVNPTREGYTFAGWTGTGLTAATMNVTIAKGSIGERSYTATWTADTYTISYDLAGGAVATANPTTYTIESDAITLVNPTREGYEFAGWTGTGLTAATKNVTIAKGSTGNRTYTATWTAKNYTIAYTLNGGEVTGNPTSYTIESDAITLVNPTRKGYDFAGWTGTGLTAATMNVTIAKGSTGDRSYTATWTAKTYTITYDLDEGAWEGGTNPNPVTYTIESEDITLVAPVREGYSFTGWTGTGLTEPTMVVVIAKGSTENRSYKATWQLSTGISAILSSSKKLDVYTIDGRLVKRGMTADEVRQSLRSGMYIINGKKVVLK